MNLDLVKLNSGVIDKVELNQSVNIPEEYYNNTDIKDLKDVKLVGNISTDVNEIDVITLDANLSGIMILEDSIGLELVEYPFLCKIEEKIECFQENYSKSLDINEILWQNIILEVPLKFTCVENFDEYQGDGWKLISEDSVKNINNPFNELKDMIGEE